MWFVNRVFGRTGSVNGSILGFTGETAVCQNVLVPAPRAASQKNRPYRSDIYTASFHAIPRGAREQGCFDTPSWKVHLMQVDNLV